MTQATSWSGTWNLSEYRLYRCTPFRFLSSDLLHATSFGCSSRSFVHAFAGIRSLRGVNVLRAWPRSTKQSKVGSGSCSVGPSRPRPSPGTKNGPGSSSSSPWWQRLCCSLLPGEGALGDRRWMTGFRTNRLCILRKVGVRTWRCLCFLMTAPRIFKMPCAQVLPSAQSESSPGPSEHH